MENDFLLVELGRRGININDRTSLTGLRCASSAAAAIVSPGTRDAVLQCTSGAGATASCWSGLRCFLFTVSASALGVRTVLHTSHLRGLGLR
jgi:hypothetical protein